MSQHKTCPFCGAGDPAGYIGSTQHTLVRYPLDPAIRYHLLLIPKRHIAHMDEMRAAEASDLMQTLQKIVANVRSNLGDEYIGYNLLSNNGDERVNQRVDHAHLHVFLRLQNEHTNPLLSSHQGSPNPLNDEQIATADELRNWLKTAL